MSKSIITTVLLALLSLNAQSQFDMSGGAPEEEETPESEIRPYSEVQKKNQNKIVFSSEHIPHMKEDATAFKNTFNLGDPIYFRAYHDITLEKGAKKYMDIHSDDIFNVNWSNYSLTCVMKVNGIEKAVFAAKPSSEDYVKLWVSESGFLYDNNDDDEYYSGGLGTVFKLGLAAMGTDLKVGSYDIELIGYAFPDDATGRASVEGENRDVKLFSGKFKLNVKQEGINKLVPALCKFVKKPSGALDDSDLEAKIATRFNQLEEGSTAKLVYLLGSDWDIHRNNYGKILYRFIDAKVIFETSTGEFKTVLYQVTQNFDGANYSNVLQRNKYLDEEPVCPLCIEYFKANN